MQKLPSANFPAKISGRSVIYETVIFNLAKKVTILYSLVILVLFSACNATKTQVYFENLQKDTTLQNLVSKNLELKIQKNDMLGITVASMSPDNAFYNLPQNSIGLSNGYQVDENGNIQFVKIGTLHVEGMTRMELKAMLEKDLIPYLKESIVNVVFLNRHVTMLGAISPQVLPMPGDNMTILDALASSGDIGEKGRIDNVLVIREKDNSKDFKRLNLKDNSIFYSPYFYLRPNDIIYVEPRKVKANNAIQIITYLTTGITFIIFILDRLKL